MTTLVLFDKIGSLWADIEQTFPLSFVVTEARLSLNKAPFFLLKIYLSSSEAVDANRVTSY